MRKLPDAVVAEHLAHDNFAVETLLSNLPQGANKNIEHYSGAFRAIFLSMLHKREIGEAVFDAALRLMIHGLVIQLMED